MYNIYIIKHKETGYKYLGYDKRPLNKVWKEIHENYTDWNGSLWNTMKRIGINSFKISIVEEVQDKLLNDRVAYWIEKYNPEYNKDVFDHVNRKKALIRKLEEDGVINVYTNLKVKETRTSLNVVH